jgi:alkanesulfonate monooxygenase SsuD/methylene tetrahydromethanopterin reductase-like flavin-dependent oxidoreductase (luciferase family)
LKRAAEVGDSWIGVAHTPDSVRPLIAALRGRHAKRAGRCGSIEITVGPAPGLTVDRDAAARLRCCRRASTDRIHPGFVPRARIEPDLFPQLERFAASVMTKA